MPYARIIERAAFKAYQIGGFALAGAAHAVPDVGLDDFGEKVSLVRQISNASALPVLVDADDGYGDAKSVARTVREYEAMGVAAIFIEDQAAAKKCGHMEGKRVIEQKSMVHKIDAACAARESNDFLYRPCCRSVPGSEPLDRKFLLDLCPKLQRHDFFELFHVEWHFAFCR